MADILSVGGGASAGLDTYLNRLLVQQQLAEKERSDKAEEDIRNRGLDQNDWVKNSLAEEHDARVGAVHAAAAEAERRRGARQKLMEDPNTPDPIRQWLRVEDVMSGDKTAPYELVQPNQGKTTPPGPVHELSDNSLVRVNPDNSSTPILAPQDTSIAGPTAPGTTNPAPPKPAKAFHQPDRVLLQTGEGYMPRDKARAILAGGGDVPLATTSATRTMGEGAKMLKPHIVELSHMADQLDKAGLFGPVMSRIRHVGENVGTIDEFFDAVQRDPELQKDPLVGEFATSLGLMATGAGRVHGGARGGGSPQMYSHFKSMLSDSSTSSLFKGRLNAVDKYMTGYAAGPGGTTQEQAVDPYQEYLNRTKKQE